MALEFIDADAHVVEAELVGECLKRWPDAFAFREGPPAEVLTEGRRYPEAEVNAILQRRHWDSATMRREMVGWRMLAREAGVYWRLPMQQWEAAA